MSIMSYECFQHFNECIYDKVTIEGDINKIFDSELNRNTLTTHTHRGETNNMYMEELNLTDLGI